MVDTDLTNPFKPGAGHMPPYLAGRESEKREFTKLISQTTILENLVLTGLRGVGKTVLLDVFKPIAQANGWFWVGTDLSEAATLNEKNISTRLLTDLSVLTSSVAIGQNEQRGIGFTQDHEVQTQYLNFQTLMSIYEQAPGLPGDKLKYILEMVWSILRGVPDTSFKGIIFAYDEAQNLADHTDKDQFPLSLLLDTFQSIQKKEIPFMLALTGLPTLFPKLVESRTFSERMFRVMFLDKLDDASVVEAIKKPLENYQGMFLSDQSIDQIVELSGGYPYFVQFICREVYDVFIQKVSSGLEPTVPVSEIVQKLDTDFFSGRWARATDRQRELLAVIAEITEDEDEFAVQDVVYKSKEVLEKPFSSSHVNQVLSKLADAGLVYKNRHGKYSFAVPLLGGFIKRQQIPGVVGST
jgi:hypothetical protein